MKELSPLFGQEHDLFRRSVRSFVEREVTPKVDEWESTGLVDTSLYQQMGALGFLGIRYPAEYGGAEGDIGMTVAFCEELNRCRSLGFAMGVMVDTDMASPHIARTGTDAQKRAYLAPIIAGEKICAVAVTEPGAGSNVAGIRTTARRDGDVYVLNGGKLFITNSVIADVFVVAAKTAPEIGHRGISMFLVEKGTPGFTVARTLDKLGMRSSDTGELVFQDCAVPAANLLGELNRGFYAIMQNFQDERLVCAVACYASAQLALEDTIRYVGERPAFDGTLFDLQVTKHKLAKLATEIEAARQLTHYTAWLYGRGVDAIREVSMAKAFCAEVANRVAYDCLQLHGGYGYTKELWIERYFRDIRLYPIGGGATEVMYDIIAKRLAD
ncbi:MAG: acyl-CoA dehydrogenase family protein [Chloroflexi bacterium]|nr:acyl-CoA dehydrogenase family protein [Chloroflexota bacterium]